MLALSRRLVPVSWRASRLLSTAASEAEAPALIDDPRGFSLFKAPTVATPSFEFVRAIANQVAKASFQAMVHDYSDDELVSTAANMMHSVAEALTYDDEKLLFALVLSQHARELLTASRRFSPNVLHHKLLFSKENIIQTFIHSTLLSPSKAFAVERDQYTFFATVVGVIDPNRTEKISLRRILKESSDDVLFCNVTLCRPIIEKSLWKVSHINYFDRSCIT